MNMMPKREGLLLIDFLKWYPSSGHLLVTYNENAMLADNKGVGYNTSILFW